MIKKIALFLAILAACTCSANAQDLHISKKIMIGGNGGWDYLAISPATNWLYVSHGTKVNIIDKLSGDAAGVIENTTGVHGIAFAESLGKGYTSNGRLNTLTVFDLKTNKVTGGIAVGINPDAIFYEPTSKSIIVCNGRSKSLSIVDPAKDIVTDTVALPGKPETAVSDGVNVYVNIEDKNQISVVSIKDWKLVKNINIAPGEEPTGLVIDKETKKLFAGCDKQLIVVDITTGKVVSKIPIGEGCDGVAFDPSTKNIYTSNGESGTVSIIHEDKDGKCNFVKDIKTQPGARTITLDETTHKIYLPVAEFEPMAAGATGRPSVKDGSFQVLVLEN